MSIDAVTIQIAWSEMSLEWSHWRSFRMQLADRILHPGDECDGNDDSWYCRLSGMQWRNVQYVVPLTIIFALSHNDSVAYQYTRGFAFIYRGNTSSVDRKHIEYAHVYNPPPIGLNLDSFEALVASTMTGCRKDDSNRCVQTKVQNYADAPYEKMNCMGLNCTDV